MTGNDLEAFGNVMKGLAEIFDTKMPMSPVKIELYYKALEDLTIEQVKSAAAQMVKTREYPSFPKPAEFRKQLGASDADRPQLAWAKVDLAVRTKGPYQNVRFDDPVIHSVINAMGGWAALCSCSDRDWPWRQKDFEKLYPVMARQPQHDTQLIGIHGRQPEKQPALIGELAGKSLKLIAGGK